MNKLALFFLIICLFPAAACVTKDITVTETYSETQYRTESFVEVGEESRETLQLAWRRFGPLGFKALEWIQSGGMSSIDGYQIDTANKLNSRIKLTLSKDPQTSLWGIMVINLTGVGPLPVFPSQSGTAYQKLVDGKMVYKPNPQEQAWIDTLDSLTQDQKRCLFFGTSDKCTRREINVDVTGMDEIAVITCTPPHWLVGTGPTIEKVELISCEGTRNQKQVSYEVEQQKSSVQTTTVPFWEIWEPTAQETVVSLGTTDATSPDLIFGDDFSTVDTDWPLVSKDGCESYCKDGEYHISIDKSNWALWLYNTDAGKFSNSVIETDARFIEETDGPECTTYGLIFGCQDDDNLYRFLVSADGKYLVGKRQDAAWTVLQPWTTSEYIKQGSDSNHLKAVCVGSKIEVYDNGYRLCTVSDHNFTDGYVGMIVYTTEPGAHVAFDNFKISSVD
jgi:hypothetical protein